MCSLSEQLSMEVKMCEHMELLDKFTKLYL